MKIGVFGNNLNQGYFLVSYFQEIGIHAQLLLQSYPLKQEHHSWWTSEKINKKFVYHIDEKTLPTGSSKPLKRNKKIQQLYNYAKKFDVLILSEEGPALFSELEGPIKVFRSYGSDLQVIPFKYDVMKNHTKFFQLIKRSLIRLLSFDISSCLTHAHNAYKYLKHMKYFKILQKRQRIGLSQCCILICDAHQTNLLKKLKLSEDKVYYLPVMMDFSVIEEFDSAYYQQAVKKFSTYKNVFIHPTRQYYLKINHDEFLKDNDKLIEAYARFIKAQKEANFLLLLFEKGREKDIEETKKLIKVHDIEEYIEWIGELPNKQLRSLFKLNNAVICDQYNPNISILGNLGREATMFGRPLLTSFNKWNSKYFSDDLPPNVFHCETISEIEKALFQVANLKDVETTNIKDKSINWSYRHLNKLELLKKYKEIIESTLSHTLKPGNI